MIFTVPVANQNDANAYVIIMSCMCANFIESTTLVNFTISTDSKATDTKNIQCKKCKTLQNALNHCDHALTCNQYHPNLVQVDGIVAYFA